VAHFGAQGRRGVVFIGVNSGMPCKDSRPILSRLNPFINEFHLDSRKGKIDLLRFETSNETESGTTLALTRVPWLGYSPAAWHKDGSDAVVGGAW
jgi:hypothetical protein